MSVIRHNLPLILLAFIFTFINMFYFKLMSSFSAFISYLFIANFIIYYSYISGFFITL